MSSMRMMILKKIIRISINTDLIRARREGVTKSKAARYLGQPKFYSKKDSKKSAVVIKKEKKVDLTTTCFSDDQLIINIVSQTTNLSVSLLFHESSTSAAYSVFCMFCSSSYCNQKRLERRWQYRLN